MQEVIDKENQLGLLGWLLAGDYGRSRTRGYSTKWSISRAEAFGELRRLISKHKVAAEAVSSTGIGPEMIAGDLAEPAFTATLHSPGDVVVMDWSRVTVRGQVNEASAHECDLLLWIRPAVSGLIASSVGALLGLIAIVFGLVMFAAKSEWQSFGIAFGIGLALILIPFGLLLWSIAEGRQNEAELLNRIALCMEAEASPKGL